MRLLYIDVTGNACHPVAGTSPVLHRLTLHPEQKSSNLMNISVKHE
jgi:hypothetical protein